MTDEPSSLSERGFHENYGALDTCRACLAEDRNLYPLFFELDELSSIESNIRSMYISCTGINATLDDEFPKHICNSCLEDLYTAYEFWKKCQDSIEKIKLIELKNSVYIKDEINPVLERFEIYLEENDSDPDIKPEYIEMLDKEQSDMKPEYIEMLDKEQSESDKINENLDQDLEDSHPDNETDTNTHKVSVNDNARANKENKGIDQNKENKINTLKKHHYRCHKCVLEFSSKKDYNRHVFKHTRFLCEICGHISNTVTTFAEHATKHSSLRAFKCQICGRQYKTNSSLQNHMRNHKGEKKYMCSHCGEKFINWNMRFNHIRTYHTTVYPFKCDICDKSFKIRGRLIAHKRTHTGEKPYPCPECPRAFSTRSGVRKHMPIHTGERKYSCTLCDKKFSRSYGVTQHMVTHTGERKHKCEKCGKTFTQRHVLRNHQKTHADEQNEIIDT